jgi:Helix-turn-helix domain
MERLERVAREDPREKGSTPMKKLFIEKQVAVLLEVAVKTLQGWRYKGGGPPFAKMGRLIRYAESDLEAFVLEKRRTSTSDRGRPLVSQLRPGITIRRVPEHERTLGRPPAVAYPPATTPRPAPGSPTRRRHSLPRGRVRIRVVLPNQQVSESAPRPAR